MNLISKDIKVGLKVIMTSKVGILSNWAPHIGKIFEIEEIDNNYIFVKAPKGAITKTAAVSLERFWIYFRLPPSHQLEFNFES